MICQKVFVLRQDDKKDVKVESRAKLEYSNCFSVGDLTSIFNVLGLSYHSHKEQLTQNIICSLMDINSLANENDDSDTEDEKDDKDDGFLKDDDGDDDENTENEGGSVVRSQFNLEDDELDQASAPRSSWESQAVKFSMRFRDIEETIREFNGNDNFPVER